MQIEDHEKEVRERNNKIAVLEHNLEKHRGVFIS